MDHTPSNDEIGFIDKIQAAHGHEFVTLRITKTMLVKSTIDANRYISQFFKNAGIFNFEEAEQSAGWMEELNKDHHTPETEEYGISSFVYRRKRPFDPDRFWNYIQNHFPSTVIRSKGLFWLASRPKQALIWGQAGGSLRSDNAGVWWASMPFNERIRYSPFLENQKMIESDWDLLFGDRKNEIVFIGQNINKALIAANLDTCLATDKELAIPEWELGYQDDWPVERIDG